MSMMKGDIQNYRRARTISLLGAFIQLALTIGLGIYTAFSGGRVVTDAAIGATKTISGDHAALTATVYAGLGVVVWLTLAFLYDWHRRERQEAIEIERLEADPASSAFQDAAAEVRVAARRLAGFQKFGLTIVSLSVGVTLVVVGLVRLTQGRELFDPEKFDRPLAGGFALVLGIALAFVGFVFARFVSGMAKQGVWSNLRAGAAYSMGTSLLGLAMTVAQGVVLAGGPDGGLRSLQVAFPVFLMAMGAEIFLNFVLDLYRPRKAGQAAGAAFDSRVLGLLAAPDRIAENIGEAINYQFGVEVSRTWFYRLLERWWLGLVMMTGLVMWLMTTVVIVESHQLALILTNGAPQRDAQGRVVAAGPGLHFKMPYPIGEVYIPSSEPPSGAGEAEAERAARTDPALAQTVTGVRVMNLGTNPPREDVEAILWTNDHVSGGQEFYNLVHPSPFRTTLTAAESGRLAAAEAEVDDPFGDLSLVAIELPTHWVVDDLYLYDTLAEPKSREELIKLMGQREALHLLSTLTIDDVLGSGRDRIASELRDRLERTYARIEPGAGIRGEAGSAGENGAAGAGVKLLYVGAGNVHPPKDAAESFERVVQAGQVREARIESARELAIETRTRVAAVGIGADGQRVDAETIVKMIDDLDTLRRSGASATLIAEAELEIRRRLQSVGGEAGSLLAGASARRWERHMGERGLASLYLGQLEGFRAAPGVFMASRYFEAMTEAVKGVRLTLLDDLTIEASRIRFDLQTKRESSVFDPSAGNPASGQ